jgi:outer membrane protein TolC
MGQGQRNTAAENNVSTLSTFIGIDATWNVFDGFETSARKRESRLRQRRLEQQLEAYRAELRAQAVNVVQQIGFLARQYQLDERRTALAEQSFNIQKREMDEGRMSAPVFRQHQLGIRESRLAELRVRVRLILALNDYLDLTLPAAVDTF